MQIYDLIPILFDYATELVGKYLKKSRGETNMNSYCKEVRGKKSNQLKAEIIRYVKYMYIYSY